MNSCLYVGHVKHRRHTPFPHAFQYSLFQVYLDLGELDEVFRRRWLWSARRPAIAWFRRRDHFGDPNVPLDTTVRDLVAAETGHRPAGPIRLLTHLRYFGYVINPLSLYYCFDAEGKSVETIVAEVHNTPWNERHCYVLPSPVEPQALTPKEFHVSPFMGMDMQYRWRLAVPGENLTARVENYQNGDCVFDAELSLRKQPMTGWRMAAALARRPWMTLKVFAAIYWQALRLKLKGARFHSHPKHTQNSEVAP